MQTKFQIKDDYVNPLNLLLEVDLSIFKNPWTCRGIKNPYRCIRRIKKLLFIPPDYKDE